MSVHTKFPHAWIEDSVKLTSVSASWVGFNDGEPNQKKNKKTKKQNLYLLGRWNRKRIRFCAITMQQKQLCFSTVIPRSELHSRLEIPIFPHTIEIVHSIQSRHFKILKLLLCVRSKNLWKPIRQLNWHFFYFFLLYKLTLYRSSRCYDALVACN